MLKVVLGTCRFTRIQNPFPGDDGASELTSILRLMPTEDCSDYDEQLER